MTVIELAGLPAGADVGDAVEGAPGVVVQRLGGLGDWSAVSLRGSTTRQVEILLDGVPLNPDGAATVNLSELPVGAFERVEVWRGAAPPELGVTAVGGAINLVTGDRDAGAVSAAIGAFGTAKASASAQGGAWLVLADAFATRGAFRYFDDRGTVYNAGDDRYGLRGNNDKGQLSAHLRWRGRVGPAEITVLDALLTRSEGVPGPVGHPTRGLRYETLRDLLSVRVDAPHVSVTAWTHLRRERLDDPLGETGFGPREAVQGSATYGVRGRYTAAPIAAVSATAVVEARREAWAGDVSHARYVAKATGSVSLRAARDRLSVVPTLTGLATVEPSGHGLPVTPLPRASLVVRPTETLTLKADAGAYLRLPDLLELHGDSGAFVGRPDLRPERGAQADVGARLALPPGFVRGDVEVGAFGSDARDLIVWVPSGRRSAVPINIGRGRILGFEAAAVLTWPLGLSTSTNLTRLASVNLSPEPAYAGNQLPGIPGWELRHRTSVALGPFTLGHSLDLVGANHWDATNWYRAAPRHLQGAWARYAFPSGVAVELDARNLGDRLAERVPRNPLDPGDPARVWAPVTDFSGFPLAGRAVLLAVRWRS